MTKAERERIELLRNLYLAMDEQNKKIRRRKKTVPEKLREAVNLATYEAYSELVQALAYFDQADS